MTISVSGMAIVRNSNSETKETKRLKNKNTVPKSPSPKKFVNKPLIG